MMTIGLTDTVSKPLMSINNTLTGMKKNATGGFENIRGGAMGLAASGLAIKTFMQPVYEMQRRIGEVASLEVAQQELDALKNTSLLFSVQYGESAADFVGSSYDIQSAITGLRNGELAKFTLASNVLAKSTKADAATITDYMGTMYGIFQDKAKEMGKSEWVEQLTGQTATAVQMFKTTGAGMANAFTSLGANAKASGVGLSEQMAILGTLQATMSGSEAGTKYRSFLAGIAKAQDNLGLKFTDSQGRLLPMLDVLKALKQRFGDTFDEVESLKLKQAFGSQEAVSMIKLLMGQTNGLADAIHRLDNVQGMQKATEMAKKMVDPWDQFVAVTEALRIKFGDTLLPTINDLLTTLNGGLTTVMSWVDMFPNITRWIGYAAMATLGLSFATGLFTIWLGLARTAMAAWGVGVILFKGLIIGLSAVFGIFGTIMKAVRTGILLFNLALYANPIGLVVVAVVGLIAVLGQMFGIWGKVADAFKNTSWGKSILSFFDKLGSGIKKVMSFLGLDDLFATVHVDTSKVQPEIAALDNIPNLDVGDYNRNVLANMPTLQGVTGSNNELFKIDNQIQGLNVKPVNVGNSSINKNNQNSTTYGDVHISSENPMTPEDLEAWAALKAG